MKEAPDIKIFKTRVVSFITSTWCDIRPDLSIIPFVVGFVVGIPVLLIIWCTTWLLCKVAEKPMNEDAYVAGICLLAVIGLFVKLACYLREKWHDTNRLDKYTQN